MVGTRDEPVTMCDEFSLCSLEPEAEEAGVQSNSGHAPPPPRATHCHRHQQYQNSRREQPSSGRHDGELWFVWAFGMR